MSNDFLCEIKEKVADADLVLVGIGEQLAVPTRFMEQEERYSSLLENDNNAERLPYLQQIFIKEDEKEYIEFYNRLFELIENKNYYVLTTNADDVIYKSNIDANRIVAPCGSVKQFVCKECKGAIEHFEEEDVTFNYETFNSNEIDKMKNNRNVKCIIKAILKILKEGITND